MNEHLSEDSSTAHIQDTSGLEELKQAMDEINKLSSESDPVLDNRADEKDDLEQEKKDEEINSQSKDIDQTEEEALTDADGQSNDNDDNVETTESIDSEDAPKPENKINIKKNRIKINLFFNKDWEQRQIQKYIEKDREDAEKFTKR